MRPAGSQVLLVMAVAFVGAGWLLGVSLHAFEDAWKDPRMARRQRLTGSMPGSPSRRASSWLSDA
jgi:hypothetical protein